MFDAAKYMRERRKLHPEQFREYDRRKREKMLLDPVRTATYRKQQKRYRDKAKITAPRKMTSARLKHVFGITLDDKEALLAKQSGRCAICTGDDPGARHRGWSTDHCHRTGKIRGILCHKCNSALGLLKENIDSMRAMILYVETHNG